MTALIEKFLNEFHTDGVDEVDDTDDGVNKLGIDVATADKAIIMTKLKRLTSTKSVTDGGEYREDREISQIHIDSILTEDDLDDWLYKALFPRQVEIHGVFERVV